MLSWVQLLRVPQALEAPEHNRLGYEALLSSLSSPVQEREDKPGNSEFLGDSKFKESRNSKKATKERADPFPERAAMHKDMNA